MKKLIALAWLLTGVPAVLAIDLPLGNERGRGNGVWIEADGLYREGGSEIDLSVTVSRLTATSLKTEAGEFTYLNIPGFQQTGDIGAPSLPVMNRIVEVPLGGKVEIEVVSSTRTRVDLAANGLSAPVFPRQPPQPKDGSVVPFAWQRQAYLAPGLQQEALARVEEIGTLRDMRLVLVRVAPVAYDPTTGALEVQNDIQVKVRIQDADLRATAEHKARYFSPFFAGLRAQVLAPESLRALDPASPRPRTYAIVVDKALEAELAPFVAWKKEQGFDVIVANTDTVAADASAIQTHVHGLYKNPGEGHGAPDFLLLVGDHDNLPSNDKGEGGWSSHLSDLDYAAVTEGDYLPDILYGRFSARNAEELRPQVQKTVQYERFEMPDPSFLKEAVMTAGWDYSKAVEWGWPQIKYANKYYFNADNGFTEVSTFLSSASDQNAAEIIAQVGQGAAFVNYTAHGSSTSWADPGFEISDVDALGNAGKYPFVVANCCQTSAFSVGTCFGESWLRAADRGAIGYIGGSNNTYWDEDLWWGNGFYAIAHPNEEGEPPNREDTGVGAYDVTFQDPNATAASMMLVGNLAVEQSNSDRKLYYWEVYHLFGDPSLQIFMGLPSENAVEHTGTIVASESTYQVKAAAGSYVGLTLDGTLLAAGVTGAEGVVDLPLTGVPASGSAKLVVTAKNRKPYFGCVAIGR